LLGKLAASLLATSSKLVATPTEYSIYIVDCMARLYGSGHIRREVYYGRLPKKWQFDVFHDICPSTTAAMLPLVVKLFQRYTTESFSLSQVLEHELVHCIHREIALHVEHVPHS
jgi:hypothetical protein